MLLLCLQSLHFRFGPRLQGLARAKVVALGAKGVAPTTAVYHGELRNYGPDFSPVAPGPLSHKDRACTGPGNIFVHGRVPR